MSVLDREALITGLRLLVGELQARGLAASVRIVGGAAMALRYYERDATRDIDVATSLNESELEEVARTIAANQGWSPDWLNASAALFVPSYGRAVEWVTVHDEAGVIIQIAPPEAMLAMKLNANRPGRDDEDLRVLMAICDLTSLAELETLFEQFYPGDVLSDRAIRLVEAILSEGALARPAPMPELQLRADAPSLLGEQRMPDLPPSIGRVALAALAGLGVTRLDQLSAYSEEDLRAVHGIGPKALRILGEHLAAEGLSLRQ